MFSITTTAKRRYRPWSATEFNYKQSSVLPYVSGYIEACPLRFFVTLTTPKPIDSYRLSATTGRFLHRLNRKAFGAAYSGRKRHSLATLFVHEETAAQQLHAHGLIGVPEPAIGPRSAEPLLNMETLVKSIWFSMDDGGLPEAQDVTRITEFEGVDSYVQKRLWDLQTLDHLDLPNTSLPDIPARLHPLGID